MPRHFIVASLPGQAGFDPAAARSEAREFAQGYQAAAAGMIRTYLQAQPAEAELADAAMETE
jgi:hypothetical protein